MKILNLSMNYKDRWNFAHELWRDALYAGHEVVTIGPGHELWGNGLADQRGVVVPAVLEILCSDANAIFVHHIQHLPLLIGMANITHIPKILFCIDYFPRNYALKTQQIINGDFDMVVFPEMHEVEAFMENTRKIQCKTIPLHAPFGVDTDFFQDLGIDRDVDVMALFSMNTRDYPNRQIILNELKNMSGFSTYLQGVRKPEDRVIGEDYVRLINKSKIGVCSNDRWGSLSLRHLEYMACGTVVMTDYSPELYALGFRPDEHYFNYSPRLGNLTWKIREILANPPKMFDVVSAAQDLVRNYHSNRVRAASFWSLYKSHFFGG
jgi:hypothetical protein